MIPVEFAQSNRKFLSAEADELPAHTDGKIVTTCWHLTWRERFRLLLTGRIWAQTTAPVLGLDLDRPQLPPARPPK